MIESCYLLLHHVEFSFPTNIMSHHSFTHTPIYTKHSHIETLLPGIRALFSAAMPPHETYFSFFSHHFQLNHFYQY